MRKYFFMIFATFFAGNLWAACQPTTNVLENRSGPDHDEYLYENTREREIRQNKGQGKAYLCGYVERNGCPRGERFAFRNAAVGADNYTGLTVYTCAGGGDNYRWDAVSVEEKCYSDERVNSESVGGMTLYKLGNNKYCEHVVYLKNLIRAIADDAIANNNDTLLKQFWEELNTKIGDIYNSDAFMNAVVNVVNGMDKALSEDKLNTIIGLITQGIQESGFADQIGDIQSDIEGIKNRISNLEVNVTQLKEDLKNTTSSLLVLATNYDVKVKVIEAEFEKVWAELGNKMTKEDVEKLVKTYIIDLEQKIMQKIEETNGNLDEFKKEVADIEKKLQDKLEEHGIKITELDERITELESRVDKIEVNVTNLRTDLKNTTDSLLKLAVDYGVKVAEIEAEFENVWEELKATMTKEEIEEFVNKQIAALDEKLMEQINKQGKELENFKKEVKEIEDKLKARLDQIEIKLKGLESRINDLEAAKTEIMSKLENLARTDASLQSAIDALEADLVNKVTMEQVLNTVAEKLANADLNDNQRKQVIQLIEAYTINLSDGQRQQVEIMIQEKIGKKFDEFDAANQLQDKQRKSQDKVNSAMSVLNAFAAGQDASVWRNADGKFNTARLASDATAGVILGTAGGLISNKVIKKNQIKKGFEGIGCYVGGQVVADYGDEFTVGMM